MTTQIQILGPGCARCKQLYEGALQVVTDLGLDAQVEKVEDVSELVARGILTTPALVVDDKLVLAGQVPSARRLRELLTPAAG
jgi:small redox-active disulfide protein 2